MKRAIRVGITGKIGSGKSTLSALMRASGIEVIDTDSLAKELMESSPEIKDRLTALLGSSAYKDGSLDRTVVAQKIFGNDATRRSLEAIVHPAVSAELERQFNSAAPGAIVAAESALILQSNLAVMFDFILLVEASDESVRSRLAGKLDDADIEKRLADQAYDSVSRETVDITIRNDASVEEFERRAGSAIGLLKVLSMRDLPEDPLHLIEDHEIFEDVDDNAPIS